MYNTIINPQTNRKVNIYGKLGISIIRNYLQKGGMSMGMGMELGEIYLTIKDNINEKDPETFKWLVEKRLSKPRGVLTFILNKLNKEGDEIIIRQKINKLGESIAEINEIIKESISDVNKKDKILEILEGGLSELEPEPIVYCKVCGEPNCQRGIRCGRSYNFENMPL